MQKVGVNRETYKIGILITCNNFHNYSLFCSKENTPENSILKFKISGMSRFTQPLDIRISFFVRKSFTKPNGRNPIVLRIGYRGQRRDVFTGLDTDPAIWNSQDSRIVGTTKEILRKNNELERIQYKVREHFDELKFLRKVFTIDELILKIKGEEEPPQSFLEYADRKIEEYRDKVGLDIAITTFYKYKRTRNYLIDFLQEFHRTTNIAVASVNEGFLRQFFKYLRQNKGNSHNSALALMNCLRTILKEAIKKGVTKCNPFDDFRVGFKPVDRDYLSKEEIDKIERVEILSEMLSRTRDIFLFACYTGMAYADIKQLKKDNIKLDVDGTYFIKKTRQKTNGMSIIPLINPALRILSKYSPSDDPRDVYWHIPCNQILNRNLKKVGQMVGISKPLFMHLGRHTFATTVTLSNGVPLETVSKMLGHTSLKHTVRYAKVIAEKIKLDMGKVKELFI